MQLANSNASALLDSGNSINLLSKQLYEFLPSDVKIYTITFTLGQDYMVDVPVFVVAPEIVVKQKRSHHLLLPDIEQWNIHYRINWICSSSYIYPATWRHKWRQLCRNYHSAWQPPFYECQKVNDDNRQLKLIVTWINWMVVLLKNDWQSIRLV